MKKSLLTIISSLVLVLSAFAQKGQEWITQVPQDCFCCNEKIYNLPAKPPISGPDYIACDSAYNFTTMKCPGAQVLWTVSPTANISGQTTPVLTLSPVYTASSYTITVTIKCGEKTVTNQKVVKVKKVENCSPKFTIVLTELPNGLFRIDATPQTTAGVQHFWGVLGNGNGATCTAIPLAQIQTGGTFGASVSPTGVFAPNGMGTGINPGTNNTQYGYQYSGLGNSGCYKITHWVKCCDGWYKYTQCFCIAQSANKAVNPDAGKEVTVPNSAAKMVLRKKYEINVSETVVEKATEAEVPENLKIKPRAIPVSEIIRAMENKGNK